MPQQAAVSFDLQRTMSYQVFLYIPYEYTSYVRTALYFYAVYYIFLSEVFSHSRVSVFGSCLETTGYLIRDQLMREHHTYKYIVVLIVHILHKRRDLFQQSVLVWTSFRLRDPNIISRGNQLPRDFTVCILIFLLLVSMLCSCIHRGTSRDGN